MSKVKKINDKNKKKKVKKVNEKALIKAKKKAEKKNTKREEKIYWRKDKYNDKYIDFKKDFSYSLDDLIEKNIKDGCSSEDAITMAYDDIIDMMDGKELPMYKYSLIEKGVPKEVGRNLYHEFKLKKKGDKTFFPAIIKKNASKKRRAAFSNAFLYIILTIVAAIVFVPILLVIMNSFKTNLAISTNAFLYPNADTFTRMTNYTDGIQKSQFLNAIGYSAFITVFSTLFIILFTSMTAWFLTRVKTWWTKLIYYILLFSMIVPFQMVMLPLNQITSTLNLNNMYGIVIIYIGFGAGLSTFMYSGFVKSVPVEIEEAALIDGCNPVQTFFKIVFPVLKPTTITIAVLNVMWIWNDYLLPNMVLGTRKGHTTLPVAIQMANQGSYGSINYGSFMAMIVLTIIPIVVFYLFSQKYIIKGVTAGAVKG